VRISVVTILPELIEGGLCAGVVARAAHVQRLTPGAAMTDASASRTPATQGSAARSEPDAGAEPAATAAASIDGAEPPSGTGPGTDPGVAPGEGSAREPGAASSAGPGSKEEPGTGSEARPLAVVTVNPRDFTTDRHRSVDDTPYGGGPGMVMRPEPLLAAISAAVAATPDRPARRILLTPGGTPLDQAAVRRLAALPHLVLVCGRYEGLDERVVEAAIDEEISIGDYVLSGGELGALVLLDAVARLQPGVLGEPASATDESFSDDLLEYPQYTRPWKLGGRQVPDVLASGNHAAIASWRRARALERTARRRPDLYDRHRLNKAERKLVAAMPWIDVAARTYVALVHHPVLDKSGAVVTSAVTNFDLHDIARSSRTFGLAGYFVVTPVGAQQDKVRHIARMWQEQVELDHRSSALELVRPAASLEEVLAAIAAETGAAAGQAGQGAGQAGEPSAGPSVALGGGALAGPRLPPVRVVATSANPRSFPTIPHLTAPELIAHARADERPVLLVFGTGWGLAESINPLLEQVLSPIDGRPEWNHLSVRSAVAIILDRLFGLRELAGSSPVPRPPPDPASQ
jgi:tRNA (guanine37-N1)-methyltransferase